MNTPLRFSTILRRDWLLLLLFVADILFALTAWSRLPALVPTHWNIAGEVDRMGPAWVNVWVILVLALTLYLALAGFSLWGERRHPAVYRARTLSLLRWSITLFFLCIHISMLLPAFGIGTWSLPLTVIRSTLPLLFIAISFSFRDLPRNPFIGIRLLWTLKSDEVWNKTHALAAQVWLWGGLLMVFAAFLPAAPGFIVFFAILLVMILIPGVYAFRLSRRA